MESELISYANSMFESKENIYIIIANLAYTIAFNKPCKDIYLYGDKNIINSFISILKFALDKYLLTFKEYKESNYNSLKICKFIILNNIDKDFNINCNKIYINKELYSYPTNVVMIKFNKISYEVTINLKEEFNRMLNKFINFGLKNRYIPYFEHIPVINKHIFKGFSEVIKEFTKTDMDSYYEAIETWCKKNFDINIIKEYLIEQLGKPNYYNGWR